MFRKSFRIIFVCCGMFIGLGVIRHLLLNVFPGASELGSALIYCLCFASVVLFGLIFYFIYSLLEGQGNALQMNRFSKEIQKVPLEEFIPGIVGLILGCVVAGLLATIVMGIKSLSEMYLNVIISIMLYIGLGYYGWVYGRLIGKIYKDKMPTIFPLDILKRKSKDSHLALPKVLDTSVIIDGRIQEILKTGFLEGEIIIPDFVMVELRHISDSSDDLKRNRGRRGLDILDAIQKEYGISVYDTSSNKEIAKIPEVDTKLLKLADLIGGVVVTNDYNLNKVAKVQNTGVLNINELANTLKPVSLPGEKMRVTPVKEGKTEDQSVAYLEDGTMIVVQGGRKFIGKNIEVTVTSVLQTSAGRMIFVKP